MSHMTIDRIFIVVMTLCGLILAGLVMVFPQSRAFGIPPYFWVLIPMAIFEAIAFARNRGIVGQKPFERRVVVFIFDGFFVQFCMGGGRPSHQAN